MGIKDNNEQRSLDEINSTIEFNGTQRTSQKFLAFLGPGLLVAVGYMDPGNPDSSTESTCKAAAGNPTIKALVGTRD